MRLKRFLAFVVAFAMVMSIVPGISLTAFAEDAVATINVGADKTLQSAIEEATATKGTYEIVLLSGTNDEDVIIHQTEGVNITIKGNGNDTIFTGYIEVYGHCRNTGEETLTFDGVVFNTSESGHTFIEQTCQTSTSESADKCYPHNITIQNCTFTATGDAVNTAVGMKYRYGYDIAVKNTNATGLHSLMQNYAGVGLTIDNVTITGGKSGIALGTSQNVSVNKLTVDGTGYGLRVDAQIATTITITDSNIKAFIPVVVRKAEKNVELVFNGTNTMTETNIDGIWCAVGTSEYEANGTMPTAATGEVTVTLNDADLANTGVYGAAGPKGSNSFAYTKEVDGNVRVWGEGGGNAKESYELKLYSNKEHVATTQLNNVGGIIDGDVYVTWNFFYPESTDEYWTTTWEAGHPNSAAQPTHVELWIDGTMVCETAAKMSGADDVNPVIWAELGGVKKVVTGLEGLGTEEYPYLINNLDELKWFRDKVDEQASDGTTQFAGKYFLLTSDIDLAGENWNPIGSMSGDHGSFKGVFDGGNHTIFNLTITDFAENGAGLFARTSDKAEIKNLTINNVDISSTSNYVGAVVANSYASTKITNVHVTGDIDISGRGYIGGISGHGYVVMDNVSVVGEGTISSTFWCAGGILGYAGEGTTNITNAKVEGTGEGLTITSAAGGLGSIVGMAEDNNGTQPIAGSNLSAKNVDIKTYTGAYGDSYANYALGYLYGGNDTSILTGTLTIENVTITTSTGEEPEVVDAVATIGDAIYFDLQSAVDAAKTDDTVAILRDFATNETVTLAADDKITLDLNGKTITLTDNKASGNYEFIYNYGELTVTGNGTINLTAETDRNWNASSSIIHNRGGVLVIENGTFTHNGGTAMAYVVDNSANSFGDATTTINDGTLKSSYTAIRNRMDTYGANGGGNGKATVNVNGGTLEGVRRSIWGQAATAGVMGELNITNGTLIGLVEVDEDAAAVSLVTAISGGTFTVEPYAEYLAEGFEVKANDDGTYGVVVAFDYAAWVQDELLAGRSVTLDRDIVVDGSYIESIAHAVNGNGKYPNYGIFTVVGDYDVTVDLNGYDIVYNGHADFEWNGKTYSSCTVAHGLFFANGGADLTIIDSKGTSDITVYGMASGAYVASPDTTLTIKGGTWKNKGCATCGGTNIFLYPLQGGELYIEGGYFEQALDSEGESYLIVEHGGEYANSVIDYSKTKVEISGGTFVGMNPSEIKKFNQTANNKLDTTSEPVTDGCASGFAGAENEDGTFGIVVAVAEVTDSEGNGRGYETLDEALKAAEEGDTVTIFAGDYEGSLSVTTSGITVVGETDAEGNNLVTFDKLSVSGSNITVKNINAVAIGNAGYVSGGNIVIDNCVVEGSNGFRYCYANGTVTFKNSTIKGDTYGIHFDGNAGGNIVIDNCKITGWTSFASTIEKVTISNNTEFCKGSYNKIRFYQDAELTNVKFNPDMSVDFGKEGVTAEFNNCSVTDGSELLDVVYIADIAEMGVEVYVDGELVVVEAAIGEEYYTSLADAIEAAESGDVVKLLTDINFTEGVVVASDDVITLDLAGYTITGTDTTEKNFGLITVNKGDLTVTDSVGKGKITLKSTVNSGWGRYSAVIANNQGTVTIEGGTLEHLGGTDMAYGIDNLTNGSIGDATLVVEGGAIKSTYRGIRMFANSSTKTNSLTITGGTVEGENKAVWLQSANANANIANLTIGDDAEVGSVYVWAPAGADASSLTLAANEANVAEVVDGLPEGYAIKLNNGVYGITEVNYVAQIGDVKYESLAEALGAAVDGDTVTIIADGTYGLTAFNKNLTIKAAENKNVVFDNIGAFGFYNDYTVTFENVTFDYYPNQTYTGLQHTNALVYNDCTFNGQVFLYGKSETFNNCDFNQSSADAYNVWTYGAANIAFNGCTFNSAGKSVLVYNEGATATDATFTGCTFTATRQVEGKAAIEIDTTLMPDGTEISIDNSTATGFAGGNISGEQLWNDKKSQTNLTVTVDDVQVWPVPVAEIDGVEYYTLQTAFDAVAEAGEGTVTLLANNAENVTVAYTDTAITLETGDFTYSGTITLDAGAWVVTDEAVNVVSSDEELPVVQGVSDDGTKFGYAARILGVEMVQGAQVRIGRGVDSDKKIVNSGSESQAGSGLRFITTVNYNDTLVSAAVASDDNTEYTNYTVGVAIKAEGSTTVQYVPAYYWQVEGEIFTTALTNIKVGNYIRKFEAQGYVLIDDIRYMNDDSVERSIYEVASGLLRTGEVDGEAGNDGNTDYDPKEEVLINVLNAYVNQTGIRLVLVEDEYEHYALKAHDGTTGSTKGGSYDTEAHFEVSETTYNIEENSYTVTLTAKNNAKIYAHDVNGQPFWYEYVRINNNNSAVKTKVTVTEVEEDKVYTLTFYADGLVERPENTTNDNNDEPGEDSFSE